MPNDKVLDLDALRPPKRLVKLGGHTIDCSFVPLAITFDLEEVTQELGKIDTEAIEKDPKVTKKAFDMAVKLCSIFCKWKHEEMTEQWLRKALTEALR